MNMYFLNPSEKGKIPQGKQWILVFALGVFIFILFFSPKYTFPNRTGLFPNLDPDALMHLRRIEQVVGAGGNISIMGLDRYSGFPGDYKYMYAPLLDLICTRFVWLAHAFFPGLNIPTDEVAGVVPPLMGMIFGICLFLWVLFQSGKWGLAFFIVIRFIVHPNALNLFRFHGLDHHFLEGFFLWSWLMVGVLHSARKSEGIWTLVFGGILWCGMILGWVGSSFPTAILATHAALLFLFVSADWARKYIDYVSATFLVSGAIVMIGLFHFGFNGFTYSEFSWFQPIFAFTAGAALKLILTLNEQKWRPISRWLIYIPLVVCFLVVFSNEVVKGVAALTSYHPFFTTIDEMRPISLNKSVFTMTEAISIFGEMRFYYPIGIILASILFLRNVSGIINHFGIAIFIFSCLHLRYFRWVPFFAAIWEGAFYWAIFKVFFMTLKKTKTALIGLIVILCFVPINWAVLGCAFEGIVQPVDSFTNIFINSMTWMQKHTPDPGGFYDCLPPRYGVLSHWDYGNAIAFYGRRPAIANNVQYGLDHMATVFSCKDDVEAFEKCQALRCRYLVMTQFPPGAFEKVFPWLLHSKFKDGQVVMEDSSVNWDALPAIDEKTSIYGKLFRRVGFGNKDESGLSHFRLIYMSRELDSLGRPVVKIFEVVPGAEINGIASAGAVVECSLPISFQLFPKEQRTYQIRTVADREGNFRFRVGYPTLNLTGGIKTEEKYLVKVIASAPQLSGEVKVDESAVQEGTSIFCRMR